MKLSFFFTAVASVAALASASPQVSLNVPQPGALYSGRLRCSRHFLIPPIYSFGFDCGEMPRIWNILPSKLRPPARRARMLFRAHMRGPDRRNCWMVLVVWYAPRSRRICIIELTRCQRFWQNRRQRCRVHILKNYVALAKEFQIQCPLPLYMTYIVS